MSADYSTDHFMEVGGQKIPVMEHYSENFPRVLYRAADIAIPSDDDGKQEYQRNLIAGHAAETILVHNQPELDAALADGWVKTVDELESGDAPEGRRGPGRPRKEA